MGRLLLLALIAVAAAAVVVGFVFADELGLTPREAASPGAERIRDIYWLLLAITAFVGLTVFAPLAYFIVRFRNRGGDRSVEGPQIRGNTQLEIGWTVGAGVLVVILVAFVLYKLPGITDPARGASGGAGAGESALTVRVEGRQFYWMYEYANGVTAIDTLRLPLDRQATLEITAPEGDVIHSFWVPNMAGKRDAIPGKVTSFDVLPQRTGRFDVICGEFCGIQHAVMRGAVEVVPQDEFDRWLEEQGRAVEAGTSDLGGQMWAGICQKCHDPEIGIGPELGGNPLLADREALEQVVRRGRGAMPAVGQEWSEEQMEALLDFAEQLGGGGGGQG